MSNQTLKKEITGIALLLFAVFLAGALATLALAQIRSGVDVLRLNQLNDELELEVEDFLRTDSM